MVKLVSKAIELANKLQPPPPPGSQQAIPLPGSKREGRTAVYRHWRFQDALLETLDEDIRTCHDAFEYAANSVPKNRCLGYRPWDPKTKTFGNYIWEDYGTVQQRRKNMGAGLVHIHRAAGVTDEKYGIGLWCQNRPEWQITDLAAMSQSLYTVSLYDTLGPDTTEYIINHSNLNSVATSVGHIPTLLKLKPRLPSLKIIICLDPLYHGELPTTSKLDLLNSFAEQHGVKLYTIQEVEKIGQENPIPYHQPGPSDIITINYTSGTTGNPKGVLLTHKNAIAATSSSCVVCPQGDEDVMCSFLPLAHIYERVGEHTALLSGAAIGYFHGNVNELLEDLKLLRPTAFSGVPRLYNRFAAKIKEATLEAPRVRGAISRHVVATKLARVNDPDVKVASNKHAFYDRIWSKKVAANVGLQRTRVMVSGSAPLDPSLHQFLRISFANTFVQGYGLTETYAVSLAQMEGDMSAGNCGPVAGSVEACLRDVPSMEYLATDKPNPRGELLLRGHSVFGGYYKNDEETKKVLDEDGWFATGDICSVDELGRFRIIDRVKNVLKLSQGEYVSPERIENVFLANCGYLQTAFVHGDSTQSSLIALFGIEPESFAAWASKILGKEMSMDDIPVLKSAAAHPKIRKRCLEELQRVAKQAKMNKWERVRALYLYVDPFSVENELMTPTMKLKRAQVARAFRPQLDELYAEVAAEDEARGGMPKL